MVKMGQMLGKVDIYGTLPCHCGHTRVVTSRDIMIIEGLSISHGIDKQLCLKIKTTVCLKK